MHSGADAVAFPQRDGCCGVYKATWWHLHKEEWMLLGQRERKGGGTGAAAWCYHPSPHWCSLTVILPLLPWNRDGTSNIFLNTICRSSLHKKQGADISYMISLNLGWRLMNRFEKKKKIFSYFASIWRERWLRPKPSHLPAIMVKAGVYKKYRMCRGSELCQTRSWASQSWSFSIKINTFHIMAEYWIQAKVYCPWKMFHNSRNYE